MRQDNGSQLKGAYDLEDEFDNIDPMVSDKKAVSSGTASTYFEQKNDDIGAMAPKYLQYLKSAQPCKRGFPGWTTGFYKITLPYSTWVRDGAGREGATP